MIFSPFFSFFSLVLCSLLVWVSMSGPLVVSWVFYEGSGYCLSFDFLFDYLSFSFASVVFFISSMVYLYSFFYMEGDTGNRRFFWMVFGFVISMGILVFSGNFLMVMLGWDGLGLISFCLVIYYSNYSSLESGLVTVLSNRVGDFFYLGCFSVFFWGGLSVLEVCQGVGTLLWGFLFLGAITKSAQLPFSAWLPAAMAAPTPVSSLVHSSTLVTAGVYVLLRFNHVFPFFGWGFLKGVFLFTMVFSGFCASVESDLKKVVAMSTLSQLGLMLFVLSYGSWLLCYVHMVIHAFFKSMLFLNTGGLMMALAGGQDSRWFGGASFTFSYFVCFLASGFSLVGFPFCIGFYSKDLILVEGSFSVGFLFFWVFMGGCALTVYYAFRLIFSAFSGNPKGFLFSSIEESWGFLSSVLLLFLSSWLLGLGVYWSLVSEGPLFLSGFDFLFGLGLLLLVGLVWERVSFFYKAFFFFLIMGFLRWLGVTPLSSGAGKIGYFRWEGGWLEELGGQGAYRFSMVLGSLDGMKLVSLGVLGVLSLAVFFVLLWSLFRTPALKVPGS